MLTLQGLLLREWKVQHVGAVSKEESAMNSAVKCADVRCTRDGLGHLFRIGGKLPQALLDVERVPVGQAPGQMPLSIVIQA